MEKMRLLIIKSRNVEIKDKMRFKRRVEPDRKIRSREFQRAIYSQRAR